MQKKYIKSLFTRVLLSIILFLVTSIFINYSDNNLLWYKKNLYNKAFDFAFVNNLYDKYLGGIVPFKNALKTDQIVISEVDYSNHEKYENGAKITNLVGANIKSNMSGIVVYVGEKDKYGNTVIIQGSDGVDYWYGNLENIGISLYDYVEKDTILGNPKDGTLYLVFAKNGEYLNYEDYI